MASDSSGRPTKHWDYARKNSLYELLYFYAYRLVSTHDQNLDLQKDALKSAGCEKIFVDEVSGVAIARSGLESALEVVREGDVLVVWSLETSSSW